MIVKANSGGVLSVEVIIGSGRRVELAFCVRIVALAWRIGWYAYMVGA